MSAFCRMMIKLKCYKPKHFIFDTVIYDYSQCYNMTNTVYILLLIKCNGYSLTGFSGMF